MRTKLPPKLCAHCGEPFSRAGGPRQTHCLKKDCRSAFRKIQREKKEAAYASRRQILDPIPCESCRKEFKPYQTTQRYCKDPECRRAMVRASVSVQRTREDIGVRSITEPLKKLTRKVMQNAWDAIGPYPDVARPQTRGECSEGERPCPFFGCRYHLGIDVDKNTGSLKYTRPGREYGVFSVVDHDLVIEELEKMPHSCALDAADERCRTLDEVGDLMNLTRERIRQIEAIALETMRERVESDGTPKTKRPRRWRSNKQKLVDHLAAKRQRHESERDSEHPIDSESLPVVLDSEPVEIQTTVVGRRGKRTWDEWVRGERGMTVVEHAAYQYQPRPCDRCKEPFMPGGPGHRYCDRCQVLRLEEDAVNKPMRLIERLTRSNDPDIVRRIEKLKTKRKANHGGARPRSGRKSQKEEESMDKPCERCEEPFESRGPEKFCDPCKLERVIQGELKGYRAKAEVLKLASKEDLGILGAKARSYAAKEGWSIPSTPKRGQTNGAETTGLVPAKTTEPEASGANGESEGDRVAALLVACGWEDLSVHEVPDGIVVVIRTEARS